MEEEKVRLFVGGLASEVSAGDLYERFAPLGNVQTITLPPAKAGPGHRGFAYVDFVPATDASLRKLFSAYNGCKWRGGLLRIEKAKENFADRLHREWAVEAASLATNPLPKPAEVVQQSSLTSGWQKQVDGANKGDMEASDLKIFFPSLRKLKHVPLSGLGKHKRSFQRVESSPLQLLLTCACEESLCSGSCDCSNINGGMSSLKEHTGCGDDEILWAIEVERQRQLELLNRLFPSDSTSISLENHRVVELDDSEGRGISEHGGTIGGTEKNSSEQTVLPTLTKTLKQEQPKLSLQSEIVTKGHNDPLNPKADSDNGEIGFEDDSTSTALARERAKQLELMHRLFPADAPSTREPEQVVQPEVNKVKKKRKLDTSRKSADLVEPVMDGPRDRTTDHSVDWKRTFAEINTEQQTANHEMLPKEHDHKKRVLKIIPAFKPDDSLEGASEIFLNQGDNSVPLVIAGDEDRIPVTKDVLSEDDSEMVLNVGDDSLSLAIAEEQEKDELKSLSVRTNELLEKVSEMSRHISDDSLSLANAEVRERQIPKSSQDGISDDGLEDSEMTLNLGDDGIPLSKAEEEEKALVRNFAVAKQYNWTKTDSSSGPEEAVEVEENGIEEHSSEEENYSDGSGDSDETDEADEEEDSENEYHSEEQDHSDDSSDSEDSDEADGSETEENSSEEQDDSLDSKKYSEENSSEEQDDSLDSKKYSEPIPPTARTESRVAEASLQRHDGESNVGEKHDESSKWAALADMCQFRTEGILQSEESKPERSSVPVVMSRKDEDLPYIQEQGFQVDKSEIPSLQPTDADNNRGKPADSSSPDQKLTRAAWKSLVGETGRVVFSLRQLTGLPQAPTLRPETQTVENAYTQVELNVSSETSKQNQAKSMVGDSTAKKKRVGVRSSTQPKMNAAEDTSMPVMPVVSSSEVCPFMKSENAEKEWLATKSELRSDYRTKQKYAARNVKKLWGKR